jgi:hypothetical protein
MSLDDDTDEGFLSYVWLHSQTERALFSRGHVLRLLRLAKAEGYILPMGDFIGVHYAVAKPLIERARRQLKRQQIPQLELPFNRDKGAEEFLL